MSDEKENLFPSTAHIDPVTREYVPDPDNQPFAYQNTQPHDNGQLTHSAGKPGYCKKHKRLGCEACS